MSGRANVLIAPDKFGGSMSALEAARAIALGWAVGAPDHVLTTVPLSDGGPGFVAVLHASAGGRLVEVDTVDPLERPVRAVVLVVDSAEHGRTAYVESAQACGLQLLEPAELDAVHATTAGVAALLRAALDEGAKRIVVGLGGSATTDGGAGMLAALGAEAKRLGEVELVAATDVEAPLLGPGGAAAVFGAQKGATLAMLPILEERLARLADSLVPELADLPGAGAAGGLGFGLFTLGAHRVSGADLVLREVGFAHLVAASELVITGEGSLDAQSLTGKLPARVAALCLDAGVPCVAIAGRVMLGHRQLAAAGFAGAHAVEQAEGSLEAAIAGGAAALSRLATAVATEWAAPADLTPR